MLHISYIHKPVFVCIGTLLKRSVVVWTVAYLPNAKCDIFMLGLDPHALGVLTNTWLAGGSIAYPTFSNVLYVRTGPSCHRCTYQHLVGQWASCLPDSFQCFVRKDWPLMP